MPTEVLTNILQRVRNSSSRSEPNNFAALHTTCHLWNDLAQPMLWTDIILDNESLPLFLQAKLLQNYSRIRSLTISINPIATGKETEKITSRAPIPMCGGVRYTDMYDPEPEEHVFTTQVI